MMAGEGLASRPRPRRSLTRAAHRKRVSARDLSAARADSNRNQVRFSVASMYISSRLAVATSSWSSAQLVRLAHRGRRPSCCRSSARGPCRRRVRTSSSLSLIDCSLGRYGRSSAAWCRRSCGRARRSRRWCAKIAAACSSKQQVVVAEMRAADVPVEILGLEIERESCRPGCRSAPWKSRRPPCRRGRSACRVRARCGRA